MDRALVSARLRSAKAILLDWDGCVVQSGRLTPGADVFLWRFATSVCIISNNSTDLPRVISAFLSTLSIDVPQNRIFLAGHHAVHYVRDTYGDARVFMIASPPMRDYAGEVGLNLVGRDADIVLVLRDVTFNYAKLQAAVNMIRKGARPIIANPDLTHPTDSGVAPETGALFAAINACLEDVEPVVVGKPAPHLFTKALARMEAAPSEAVMIGDTEETDMAGARKHGVFPIRVEPKREPSLGDLLTLLDQHKQGVKTSVV